MTDAKSTDDGTESGGLPLVFGEGFVVADRGGDVAAVCLHNLHTDVFGRLPGGEIKSFSMRRIKREPPASTPSPIRPGDDVLLETSAGRMRGQLTAPLDAQVSIRLKTGQDLRFPRDKVRVLLLVYPSRELVAGLRFEVKSRSGNRYEGTVGHLLPDQRALVKLTTGKTVELKLERLDLDSLLLLIPISLTDGPASPQAVAEALKDAPEVSAAEPEALRAALERERTSTKALKRKLMELMTERETLSHDVKERERLLESEVWRGLAAQRELNEARHRLEALESGAQELDPGTDPRLGG